MPLPLPHPIHHLHIQCCNMCSLESIIKCLRRGKSMHVCLCVHSMSHVPLGRKHRDHLCSRVPKATTGAVQVIDMCTVPKGTCSISCMEMAETGISPPSVVSWLWTICAKWTFCVWIMIYESHMHCWSNEAANSQFYHDIDMMLLKVMHGVLFTFYTPLPPWRYTLHPIQHDKMQPADLLECVIIFLQVIPALHHNNYLQSLLQVCS